MLRTVYAIRGILVISIVMFLNDVASQDNVAPQRARVLIETSMGDMTVELFNETPLHRDNFIKLVGEGFYDGLIFHRIISDFMVQGGDPDSKNAAPEQRLGQGGPGYTLPAEIVPGFVHQKGALAAARLGDQQNPEKRSSGSQFYIVDGRTFSARDLELQTESKKNRYYQQKSRGFFQDESNKELVATYKKALADKDQEVIKATELQIREWVDGKFGPPPVVDYTPNQIKALTEQGGAPHLDGAYTIFGQVVSGMEVIDKLASVDKGVADRPISDITMKMRVVE